MSGSLRTLFEMFGTYAFSVKIALRWGGLRALRRIRPLLGRLDARLGAKDYVLGERTVADAYLYILAR